MKNKKTKKQKKLKIEKDYNLRFKNLRQFKNDYEEEAFTYDSARSATYEGMKVDEYQINLLKKVFSSAAKKKKISKSKFRLLEAGCGSGRILLDIAKAGFNCTGFDIAPSMLKVFKNKLREKGNKKLNISLKLGSIEKIPYNSDTFDGVFTMHVLMHMPDFKKAFREMYRVAKPGGIIVMDFPHLSSPWTKLSLRIDKKSERTQLFTIQELEKYFKKYEYKITGLFSYARTFYKLPLIKYMAAFLEKKFPLPLKFRTQLIVILRK